MTIKLTSAEILALPIEELELGVRAYNILKRMGIDTIEQFQNVSAQDLNRYTLRTGIAVGLPGARQIAQAQAHVTEMIAESFDPLEIVIGCEACGGYRYANETLCANCQLASVPECPYCHSRNNWLAQDVYTCHDCAHSWNREDGSQ